MRTIALTRDGYSVLVDDEDYNFINQWIWHLYQGRSTNYATRSAKVNGRQETIFLHRVIMKTPKGLEVDHKDWNGLNCQKYNMRNCLHSDNVKSRRLPKINTSGYKGVYYCKWNNKWCPAISINKSTKRLGYFDTAKEAAIVYDKAIVKHHGEFASTNKLLGLLNEDN